MKIENINNKIIKRIGLLKSNNSDCLTVYRVCKKQEIKKIIKNDFKTIGNKFSNTLKYNTHRYEENEFYMHFFDTMEDAFRLSSIFNKYLCAYNIPIDILESGKGLGNYLDQYGYYKLEKVIEYAIKSKDININNLLSIEEMDKDLCILGYIRKEFCDNPLKLIYKKR